MKGEPRPIDPKLTAEEIQRREEQRELEVLEKRIHYSLTAFSDKPEDDPFRGNS